MRTLSLTLLILAALAAGAALGRSEIALALAIALALVTGLGLSLAALGAAPGAKLGPRSSTTALLACLLVALGLARGARAVAPVADRVPDRGLTAVPSSGSAAVPLRELEVVGASEPGARCTVELRDPRAPRVPSWRPASVRIAGPAELCPLAAGQRVAVSAQALAGAAWRVGSADVEERRSLPARQPAVWLRPSASGSDAGSDAGSAHARLGYGYWRAVAARRQRAWATTRGDPAASLVAAVGLGLRSALAPVERERLRAAGLGHLIAVSGLHVTVASLGISAVLRRAFAAAGADPRWACLLAWLPLWIYVGLTGAAASAVRAALMLMGVDLATLCGRPSHGPTLLAVTGAAMLVAVPAWLLDPGFALSMAAMAAIVSAPSRDPVHDPGEPTGAGLGPLALSWRITWATAPISVWVFDVAPLHGLLANAFALPLFALLMPAALVAMLAPAALAEPAMALARPLAQPILDLAGILARLPSVGPEALVVLAAVALLGHRWTRARRSSSPRGAGLGRWLPPRLACVLALAVALVLLGRGELERRRPGPVGELDWVAVGSVHSRSLLIADPSTPGRACLIRPRGSARTWAALVEELGVETLVVGRRDADDPGTAALLTELREAGLAVEITALEVCPAPEPTRLRAALRACRARQGGRGRALVRAHDGAIACRIGARWVAAPELGRSSAQVAATGGSL